ncbi:MAG: adenylyl-sulfate kinase [Verrucomicrobiales bacterium]
MTRRSPPKSRRAAARSVAELPADQGAEATYRGRRRVARRLPAPFRTRVHRLFHRAVRLRQIDRRPRLALRLREIGGRRVTLLDGDLVRRNLSSELGFSKEHRNLNILRIGYVAKEITKHGGIAICCPIAPYDAIRKQVRALIEPSGGFLLAHIATPLEVCEARDRKGLYAKARAGLIKEPPAFPIPTKNRKTPRSRFKPARSHPPRLLTRSSRGSAP